MAIRRSGRYRSSEKPVCFWSEPFRAERRGLVLLKRLNGPIRAGASKACTLDRREAPRATCAAGISRCAFFATPAHPVLLTRDISNSLVRAFAGPENVPRWRKDAPSARDRCFRAFQAHLYPLAVRLGARPRHLSIGVLVLQRDQGLCTCML